MIWATTECVLTLLNHIATMTEANSGAFTICQGLKDRDRNGYHESATSIWNNGCHKSTMPDQDWTLHVLTSVNMIQNTNFEYEPSDLDPTVLICWINNYIISQISWTLHDSVRYYAHRWVFSVQKSMSQ
jgi:hypothetical protein